MGALAVIPVRFQSTRFPGKPLAQLLGKPVIQHVYERVARATRIDAALVATDDERIMKAVEGFGGEVLMTKKTAQTGTERVAEAALTRDDEVIINVQGDEPLIEPTMVDELVDFLQKNRAVPMASLMTPLKNPEDFSDPNVVKVVVDREGFALFFSRSPIPFPRAHDSNPPSPASEQGGHRPAEAGWSPKAGRPRARHSAVAMMAAASRVPRAKPEAAPCLPPRAFKHMGIYGYQRKFLLEFPTLKPTPLEKIEQLEQLRALEHGHRIKLIETSQDTIGIDTPSDLIRVETLMTRLSGKPKIRSKN